MVIPYEGEGSDWEGEHRSHGTLLRNLVTQLPIGICLSPERTLMGAVTPTLFLAVF